MSEVKPIWNDYDAGLLSDFGGGNVDWWHDQIRYQINCANTHGQQQFEAALSSETTSEVDRLRAEVAWDKKYPKGTVHSKTGELELDRLVIAAADFLAKEGGSDQ